MTNHSPGAELKARRWWLGLGWAQVLLVVYLSLGTLKIELPVTGGDKLSHVVAYLVLMSWFANVYEARAPRLRIAAGLFAMNVALEFIQGWIGYRSFETVDMLASGVGIAVGWVIVSPRLPNYLKLAERVCITSAGERN